MLVLVKVSIPHDPFNQLIKDGTAGEMIMRIVEEQKPEYIVFPEVDGKRGAYFTIHMNDQSEMPSIAEPWFLSFNATCEFRIAMKPEDIGRAGLEEISKKWG